MVSPLSSCEVRARFKPMTTMQRGHDKEKARYLADEPAAREPEESREAQVPAGEGAWFGRPRRSESQRAAMAPTNAVATVTTSAAAVGHGPGIIGSNAGVRPITRPMKPSRPTPYARVAETG